MDYRMLALVLVAPALLSGCIATCFNDEGCVTSANVTTPVRGAGPFVVTLCVEEVCAEPMSTADAERREQDLELPEGPASASVSLPGEGDERTLFVTVVLRGGRIEHGTVHNYSLLVEDVEGTVVEEDFEVTFAGFHPGGGHCGGDVCRRADVSL